MGRRGGKSARSSALRDSLARRLETGFSKLKPALAAEYACMVVQATGGDINQCQPTAEWVHGVGVHRSMMHAVARAVMDELAAVAAVAVGSAGEGLAPGANVAQAVGSASHSGGEMAPRAAGDTVTQRGTGASQSGDNTVQGDHRVTAHFLPLLAGLRGLPQLIAGFEVQWELAVAAALADLQSEFELFDILGRFKSESKMSQVLFLRELKSKAVRILAHKKKKLAHKKQ